MLFSISLGNESIGDVKIISLSNSVVFKYPCSSPTHCTSYRVLLPPSRYLFEVWGAEGGYSGGLGGYTRGFLSLHNDTEINIYLGSMGPSNQISASHSEPAFNGGGIGATGSSNRACGSGGGGTDIRIGDSFHHRILVAGGGGGGNSGSINIYPGGSGGGVIGQPGSRGTTEIEPPGGSQDGPGIGQEHYGGSSYHQTHSGEFGMGGYGTYKGTNGGGGGGWYGGAGGAPSGHSSGGGGSGYILSETSFKPIDYAHITSAIYFFEQGSTKNGDEIFPSCSGQGTEHGHEGNGCARISIITSNIKSSVFSCSLYRIPIISLILSLMCFKFSHSR